MVLTFLEEFGLALETDAPKFNAIKNLTGLEGL